MIASGYTMDLYCRHLDEWFDVGCKDEPIHEFGEFPHTFTGHAKGECKKEARSLGWVFHVDGEVTCPACNSKHKTVKE